MRKVLIINNEMSIGGTEKVLLTLLKYIDKNKFDITILLPSKGDEWEYKIPKSIKVKYMFDKNPREFNKIKSMLYQVMLDILPKKVIQKIFIKDKYDVYVAFKEVMAPYLKGSIGRKICWVHKTYSRDEYESKNIIKKIWKKYSYSSQLKNFNRCDKIICVSETSRISFLNTFNIDKEKVIVLYNPNDIMEIKKLSNVDISINNKKNITMCAVGRMEPVKAFDRLINIAKKLKEKGINYNLIIIGDGTEYKKIKELVSKYKLEQNVHLVGYDENPYKYIKKSDIMLCSSISEAFSTVATEAIILGVPVITTLCSGMEELLNPNKCGIITDNNEQSLYDGIETVVLNRDILDQLKAAAKIRGNDFKTESLVKKIEDVLNK